MHEHGDNVSLETHSVTHDTERTDQKVRTPAWHDLRRREHAYAFRAFETHLRTAFAVPVLSLQNVE